MKAQNESNTKDDFKIEPVARRYCGNVNQAKSSNRELRFGTHGSLVVDLEKATFFDHENNTGGGTIELIRRYEGGTKNEAYRLYSEIIGDGYTDITSRPAVANQKQAKPRIVEEYDYFDADGVLLYQALRMEPKSFRQRQPDGNGGWQWNLKGVSPVPFHLPRLIAADPKEPVLIVEGEKDVLALEALGLVATCNSGGAGKWKADFSTHFAGRKVVILPDNDSAGVEHAQRVTSSLTGAAASIATLDLPGLPEKGDVSDWLEAGGTRAELERLIAEAGSKPEKRPEGSTKELDRRFKPILLGELDAPLKSYRLVQGLLFENTFACIYGPPGSGKSFFAMDLGLHVAGDKAFRQKRVETGLVVAIIAEGGWGARRRLVAARDDLNLSKDAPFAIIDAAPNLFSETGDTAEVMEEIAELSTVTRQPVRLIIVDTMARVMAGANENSGEDMGKVIENLDTMRRAFGCCVLAVHHSGKNIENGLRGHSSLIGAADTIIRVGRDAAASGVRCATVEKQKDGVEGDEYFFGLEGVTLGKNEHGDDVTSALVKYAEKPEAQQRKKLTSNEQSYFNALVEAMQAGCRDLPATDDFPGNRKGIQEDDWKREAQRAGLLSKPATNTERSAMRRAQTGLLGKGYTAQRDGWVWLVH